MRVRVEKPSGEDPYVLRVEDRFREAGEEFIRVLQEEGNGEGVYGELDLVGGEAEGQPGGLAHREGLIKLGGKSVEVGCEGGSGGGRVGDEEGDRTAVTGLFLSDENTIGPAIDLLALVLREASRDRR